MTCPVVELIIVYMYAREHLKRIVTNEALYRVEIFLDLDLHLYFYFFHSFVKHWSLLCECFTVNCEV